MTVISERLHSMLRLSVSIITLCSHSHCVSVRYALRCFTRLIHSSCKEIVTTIDSKELFTIHTLEILELSIHVLKENRKRRANHNTLIYRPTVLIGLQLGILWSLRIICLCFFPLLCLQTSLFPIALKAANMAWNCSPIP